MRIRSILGCIILGVCLLGYSQNMFAGLGSDDNTSPNPTGGFGQETEINSPNPVGGFGDGTGNPMPLGPPPPPPDPVPLDGGTGLLLLAAVGVGARKLYQEIKR